MLTQSGHKQLKRYLIVEAEMKDDEATLNAKKYNRLCRTYDKFEIIIKNVSMFPKVDIRDLNINQLHMAVNVDWVRRHSAMLSGVKRKAEDGVDSHRNIDWGDIQNTINYLQTCDWYKKALLDPSQMAYIMNSISSRAVQDAQYSSRR